MKTALAIVTAIVMPGGFIVLGVAFAAVLMARRRVKQQGHDAVIAL